jgi:site-specific recombinase XerD
VSDFFKAIRSFLLEYLPNQRCYSENTVKSYRAVLNLLVDYLRREKKLKVSQIDFALFDREVILGFLDWIQVTRGCCLRSRNQRLMVLCSFFEYAGILDCAQIAVAEDVAVVPFAKEQGRVVEFLSEVALKTLLEQPNICEGKGLRDQFFMTLMYDTGARCGELRGMRVRDLCLKPRGSVAYLLGKGNKVRVVALLDKTVEHCRRYLRVYHKDSGPDDLLFYTVMYGERHKMSADAVAAFMVKYGRLARVKCVEVPERVHPHQLRHTRAIHYYRDGMPLALIGELLGHSSLETTKVYAFADSEMKRVAMEKADQRRSVTPQPVAIWEDDEEMMLRLSGLKL